MKEYVVDSTKKKEVMRKIAKVKAKEVGGKFKKYRVLSLICSIITLITVMFCIYLSSDFVMNKNEIGYRSSQLNILWLLFMIAVPLCFYFLFDHLFVTNAAKEYLSRKDEKLVLDDESLNYSYKDVKDTDVKTYSFSVNPLVMLDKKYYHSNESVLTLKGDITCDVLDREGDIVVEDRKIVSSISIPDIFKGVDLNKEL